MATSINDLASAADLLVSQYPADLSATTNGLSVDMADGDGPCFAIQVVGNAGGDGTLDGHIEQSDDASTWTAISGATFAQVGGSNITQAIAFERSSRYLRWVGTLAGASPEFLVSVLIGEQKKTF